MMVIGYVLLYGGAILAESGGISAWRTRSTSDAFERIFSWFVRCLMPFAAIGLAGGLSQNSSLAFSAALGAGVFGFVLIIGMLASSRRCRFAENVTAECVVFFVSAAVIVILTNYTWSKGHPETIIGRGGGVIFLIIAIGYFFWKLPLFLKESRREKRTPNFDFIPSLVMTMLGVALAGTGATLLVSGAARASEELQIAPGMLGFAVLGLGLTIPEYVRLAQKYSRNEESISIQEPALLCNMGMLLLCAMIALISPIHVTFAQSVGMMLSMLLIAVFYVVVRFAGKLGRLQGVIMLAAYFGCFALFMSICL